MGISSAAFPVRLASGLEAWAPRHDDDPRRAQNGRCPADGANLLKTLWPYLLRFLWTKMGRNGSSIEHEKARLSSDLPHFSSNRCESHASDKVMSRFQTVVEAVKYDGSPEGLHTIAQVIRGTEFRP
jgi:hypothetical protein